MYFQENSKSRAPVLDDSCPLWPACAGFSSCATHPLRSDIPLSGNVFPWNMASRMKALCDLPDFCDSFPSSTIILNTFQTIQKAVAPNSLHKNDSAFSLVHVLWLAPPPPQSGDFLVVNCSLLSFCGELVRESLAKSFTLWSQDFGAVWGLCYRLLFFCFPLSSFFDSIFLFP